MGVDDIDGNDGRGGLAEPLLDKESTPAAAVEEEEEEVGEEGTQGDAPPLELIADLEMGAIRGGQADDDDDARLVPSARGSAVAARDGVLPPWFLRDWYRRNEESWPSLVMKALKVISIFAVTIAVAVAATRNYDQHHYRDWFPNYGYGPEDPSNLSPAEVRVERIISCAKIISGASSHFLDTDTPQMEAVEWLIARGGRHVLVPATARACLPGTEFATLYALLVLKGALGITNSTVPFWGDDGAAVDSVKHVCEGARKWHRVGCDSAGKSVISRHLANVALNGSIPREISLLTSLNRIELYGNPGLKGQFQPELAYLPNLESLKLHDTSVGGTVPANLGRLTRLHELFLEKTQLTGSMPEEICRLRSPRYGGQGALEQLHADCGGENPRMTCGCCNVCHEAGM